MMQQSSNSIPTTNPIKTEVDYEAALAEIAQMMGKVEPGTPDGDKFELLGTLVLRQSYGGGSTNQVS